MIFQEDFWHRRFWHYAFWFNGGPVDLFSKCIANITHFGQSTQLITDTSRPTTTLE